MCFAAAPVSGHPPLFQQPEDRAVVPFVAGLPVAGDLLAKRRMIEVGDHESLMSLGGTYAHLFEAQAAAYWPAAGVESRSTGGGRVP